VQIGTTAVGVKRTPSDGRTSLAFELDSVPTNNILDRVSLLQRGDVNPIRHRSGCVERKCHESGYEATLSRSGGRAYSQRDG